MSKCFLKIFTVWSVGALTYGLIEIIARGYTHISMGILGGICLVLIDFLNEKMRQKSTLAFRMFISAVIITVLEFITGIIVNVWLDLHVWDYSRIPLNLFGQICLPFFGIWFILSFFGIAIQYFIQLKIFCEESHKVIYVRKAELQISHKTA